MEVDGLSMDYRRISRISRCFRSRRLLCQERITIELTEEKRAIVTSFQAQKRTATSTPERHEKRYGYLSLPKSEVRSVTSLYLFVYSKGIYI